MLKIWEKIRAPFCWDEIEFRPWNRVERPVIVQRNTITEAKRWCYVTAPRGIPDDWKPGLPTEADCRLTPPSSGSGVNHPTPKGGDILREAMRLTSEIDSVLELGMKVEPQPRRLQLSAAPKGGYMVGEPIIVVGHPIFKTVFAGDLSDCLNFMESEMESASC